MRILGIDPGLNTTGYGVIDILDHNQIKVVEAGIVRGKTKGSLTKRLYEIHSGISEVVTLLKPDRMAVEKLYSHYERRTTAIIMGHARGVICLCAGQADIPLDELAATQIKKTLTGHGRASKEQMQLAVQRELKLTKLPEPNDVADALAIALCCHFASLNKNVLFS